MSVRLGCLDRGSRALLQRLCLDPLPTHWWSFLHSLKTRVARCPLRTDGEEEGSWGAEGGEFLLASGSGFWMRREGARS